MKNKKAAMEMSVGTIVTIVLLMTVLVLGLVLVRTIFTGATDSVSTINDKVKDKISQIFSDEGKDVVVMLGADKKAKVRVGTPDFGVAIAANTYDGGPATRERMEYKVLLDDSARDNCVESLGESETENLLKINTNKWIPFDEFDGSNVYAIVSFDIPKGTILCSQKILVDVRDREQSGTERLGGSFFTIEIIKKGVLGF